MDLDKSCKHARPKLMRPWSTMEEGAFAKSQWSSGDSEVGSGRKNARVVGLRVRIRQEAASTGDQLGGC